ncbi:GntR family transcriptional regulator [Amycolatopsis mediterranei S699]|uniref:GntR family transcriptional regulator n=2 Tax=Amycolatopsis mediterranei TaxID=33910 RepID=A0A0H3DF81_AMYMU|nr:GntR family transcriptional regulator [Amycolatopsis mediterranei]ADJ49580.1 GntR family transcriptional regulator [Amycolatopsis mediterranei U32]AEK46560.1 GntR family transcriptional regulator [Amycolatopsis mediterranei S699]AFO81289.1 GntR family transcriptional regulator [Amycolatopsis mediterranei S699]AGT88417.1 GntR family transcriptional regulator [Amycolatopsis mediterranei RB]UZF74593.1 GntR family transcriptional regulator [Amycolatopsis mediterranei]
MALPPGMLPEIEPVSRESTAAVIARQLRDAIMTGALPPGTQLGESELAARFQVSRGPLREAMQHLVSEGLLRSERHRGLFVIDLEPGDVYDIYAARSAIERAAMLRALRGGDRDRIADLLEQTVTEMATAASEDDPGALSTADLKFHEALINASGSKRLVRMARTLLIETRMCLTALQSTYQRVEERVEEHTKLIQALRDGDEETALTLLEAHMEDAVQRLAPGTSLTDGEAPPVPGNA